MKMWKNGGLEAILRGAAEAGRLEILEVFVPFYLAAYELIPALPIRKLAEGLITAATRCQVGAAASAFLVRQFMRQWPEGEERRKIIYEIGLYGTVRGHSVAKLERFLKSDPAKYYTMFQLLDWAAGESRLNIFQYLVERTSFREDLTAAEVQIIVGATVFRLPCLRIVLAKLKKEDCLARVNIPSFLGCAYYIPEEARALLSGW